MMFWGLMGEILNFQDATPLGNQSPLKHAIWCENDGDTPKTVFSRAWQEIGNQKIKKKNKNTFCAICGTR